MTNLILVQRNNWSGYDMRSNMSIDWSASGNYSTDLFTSKAVQLIRNHNKSEPLFLYLSYLAPHAPNKDKQFQSEVNQSNTFSHIKDLQRRSYAGVIHIHPTNRYSAYNSTLTFN